MTWRRLCGLPAASMSLITTLKQHFLQRMRFLLQPMCAPPHHLA